MEFNSISEIARSGMNLERNRLEMASLRIAYANVAFSSAAEASSSAQQIKDQFLSVVQRGQNVENDFDTSIRIENDPTHPSADEFGNIYFIDVDPTREMATLVSAMRAYEANIRSYNTNSEMNRSALSIGDN